MTNALLGYKESQSQQFDASGKRIPVTIITAGPCWVTRVTDTRVQLGFGTIKNMSKAEMGHIKKAGLDKKLRFLHEFTAQGDQAKLGSEVVVGDVFTAGDKVRVTGTSKGKGFAGVVKRHGFHGGPRTHGQSDRERAPGSIGQTTTPGRVYKGKRMAGRMGGDTVTIQHREVVEVNVKDHTLTVKGLVPGGKHSLLFLEKEG